MLSVRSDHPVDLLTVQVLELVSPIAARMSLPWFVVGAMARDILLTNVYGVETGRATRDVDLAVAVHSWREFADLKDQLLATRQFIEAKGIAHKLYYQPNEKSRGYPVDVIPYDGVEGDGNLLAWPPDMSEIMSVAGYQEVFDTTVEVEIKPDLRVRVVSLAGLAVLKIFAWGDRGHENSKDAGDLATLLRRYSDAGALERVHNDPELIEAADYDVELAGARLLGRDVRSTVSSELLRRLTSVLDRTERQLLTQIARALPSGDDDGVDAEKLMRHFLSGTRGE